MKLHDVGEGVAEGDHRGRAGATASLQMMSGRGQVSDKATIELHSHIDGTATRRAGEVGNIVAGEV
jgi:hypothetical protein